MRVPSDDELNAAAAWIGERLTLLLASIPDDEAYTAITHGDRGRFGGSGGDVRKQSDKGLESSDAALTNEFGGGSRPLSKEVEAGKTTTLTNISRWYSYE